MSMAVTMSGQTLLVGDTNQDGELTIADVTKSVNMLAGREAQQRIDLNPYRVDNSMVVGKWYMSDGTSFWFNANGTTTYPGGATFKFMPSQGHLIVYDATGLPIKAISLWEVTSQYLLAVDYSTANFTSYTNSSALVTGITLNHTSLSLNSGSTDQLTATATPSTALNKGVAWSSSNTEVATVDDNGLVTAVAGGSCTITASAKDGGGKKATCSVAVTQLVTNIILSQTTLYLLPDGYQKVTATVLPSNASNKGVTWTSNNTNVAEVTSSGGIVANGQGTCTITCTAKDGSDVATSCEVTVYVGNSGVVDGHFYVDLGLPSGTSWASCNIGADNPEDYGDYFAWGETVPYGQEDMSNTTNFVTTGSYIKNIFAWTTYKYSTGDTGDPYLSTDDTMTKYLNNDERILELIDDAAYVNWGMNWRMPTSNQFAELINSNYTTIMNTTMNGVYGKKITSKSNGNSIFIPLAGHRRDNELYLPTIPFGEYLSCTLGWVEVHNDGSDWESDHPIFACILRLRWDALCDNTTEYRWHGNTVRPVHASQ